MQHKQWCSVFNGNQHLAKWIEFTLKILRKYYFSSLSCIFSTITWCRWRWQEPQMKSYAKILTISKCVFTWFKFFLQTRAICLYACDHSVCCIWTHCNEPSSIHTFIHSVLLQKHYSSFAFLFGIVGNLSRARLSPILFVRSSKMLLIRHTYLKALQVQYAWLVYKTPVIVTALMYS